MTRHITLALTLALTSGMAALADDFTYGADVSWMTFQEDRGVKFYEADEATETTVEDLLHDYGFTAARLRVWVGPQHFAADTSEPTAGYCDKADVLRKARRLSAKGQRLMIAFHFSDIWADPSKQRIPTDWLEAAGDLDALTAKVTDHVADVLGALKAEGISVDWVQIGNEDQGGFMYQTPGGAALEGCLTGVSSADRSGFIHVFNAAAAKAREIYPDVKTVHHLPNGHRLDKLTWNLNLTCPRSGSVEAGTRLDADYVGLSLYPQAGTSDTGSWSNLCTACVSNIATIYANYGLRSLVVEVGMNNEYSSITSGTSQAAHTRQCNTDVDAMVRYLAPALQATGSCDGLFYWEPQSSYNYYGSPTSVDGSLGYSMGAMMDCQRSSNAWSRMKLCPNAYWDAVKELATTPYVPADTWYFDFKPSGASAYTRHEMTDDGSGTGTLALTGVTDDGTSTWSGNYMIADQTGTTYSINAGVKPDTDYTLVTVASILADTGWTDFNGWLDGDKWLTADHTITFQPASLKLRINSPSSLTAPEAADEAAAPAVYYTLQGVRVERPLSGNVYIRVQGTRSGLVRL